LTKERVELSLDGNDEILLRHALQPQGVYGVCTITIGISLHRRRW
jgi:hypothetical protein